MANSLVDTPSTLSLEESSSRNPVTHDFFNHSGAPRVNTDALIFRSIQQRHPNDHITVAPESSCNLLNFTASGNAIAVPLDDNNPSAPTSLKWHRYYPPSTRIDGGHGEISEYVIYGEYNYAYGNHDFRVYLVDGRDGTALLYRRNYYIIGPEDAAHELIIAAGHWNNALHGEIWVFNQGYWYKDPVLYKSIRKSSWSDVILDEERKSALIADVDRFFDSRDTYQKLRVPWKRGLIFYGPPGNGKTISIKAMSNSLYGRDDPIPTLYVRSLASFSGPEYSISEIFAKARATAPCLLVFEDLDSLVSDAVRSFFLNEVDGLSNNDGILMIGSTNHLERLDPGISKRPSRFDRKYPFPNPSEDERVQYSEYWRGKLKDNKDIDFPHGLSTAIAKITHGFSFAYMQEAFVAALLDLAAYERQSSLSSQAATPKMKENHLDSSELPLLGSSIILAALMFLLPFVDPIILFAIKATVVATGLFAFRECVKAKAGLTDKETKTYMAGREADKADDLEDNVLWLAIKKQVEILRKALEDGANDGNQVSSKAASKVLRTLASFRGLNGQTEVNRRDIRVRRLVLVTCIGSELLAWTALTCFLTRGPALLVEYIKAS